MIRRHFGIPSGNNWIGLNDIERENTWVWENGERLLRSNAHWSRDQPDNFRNLEDCAEVWDVNGPGRWNDRPCYDTDVVPLCEMSIFDA